MRQGQDARPLLGATLVRGGQPRHGGAHVRDRLQVRRPHAGVVERRVQVQPRALLDGDLHLHLPLVDAVEVGLQHLLHRRRRRRRRGEELRVLGAAEAVAALGRQDDVAAVADPAATEPTTVGSPAGIRLLGLLLLALGVLVLGWAYLDSTGQAALVLRVLYPASFAVALVLLFDKATRSWTPKGRAEGFREWLLCDLIVVTLVLGFLNLELFAERESYRAFFWDVIHIAAFFAVFWLLDRTQFRGRFLVAAGYLALLPLLLLLWRWLHEGEAPAEIPEISWWSTVWPTFFLGLAFFVLEIISLVAQRGARGLLVPAIKDGVFVALYAIFLIAAARGGA